MQITLPKNENSTNQPTNYYFVVDLSGSMYSVIDELKATLLATKDLLQPADTLSLAYFSSKNDFSWIFKGINIDNKNLSKLIEEKIYARGLTCFDQVLSSLKETIQDVGLLTGHNNSSLYFLSDGYANSGANDSEIVRICKSLKNEFSSATVVGYNSYYNRRLLLDMADAFGGAMNHVQDYKQMRESAVSFVKGKKSKKNIKIDKKYDFVWQVGNDIVKLAQNADNSVDVFETRNESHLFAIDLSEIATLTSADLEESAFLFSLVYLLSQQNKANVGISLLRKAGCGLYAKMLQKSFTVSQKGRAENELKAQALIGGKITPQHEVPVLSLKVFLEEIENSLGSVSIDLAESSYNSTTKKGEDLSKVEFVTDSKQAKIIDIVGNENRPNVSFLTVRSGSVTKIKDADLAKRVEEYNANNKGKEIVLPIPSTTYRNYSFISNGDFNFNNITFVNKDGLTGKFIPEDKLDLFDEEVKEIKIDDFVNIYKQLLAEKAHVSALNMYVKMYAASKQADDLRLKYGVEGKALLEEMGLDYQLRYAPKSGSTARGENDDYVPFLAISAYLAGASKISASDSYKKYQTFLKENKGKKNPGDEILWPLFDKYEAMYKSLGKDLFVETIQTSIKGLEKTVSLLKNKLAAMKFYLITTNSWFDGVDKSDEFTHNGLVIKVKEEKEYI
jgi:hypothetical protein